MNAGKASWVSELKQRALARQRWWLHRTGARPLSVAGLQQLLHQFWRHHSFGDQFGRRIVREMKKREQDAWMELPWRCYCGRGNGKSAHFCGDCAAPRAHGTPQYHGQPSKTERYWDYNEWKWKNRPKSVPRDRQEGQQTPRRERPKSKKDKRKDKEKDKNKDKPSPFTAFPQYGDAQPSTAAPWPTPSMSPFGPPPAAQPLTPSMTQMLKDAYASDPSKMPEEVKALIEKVDTDNAKQVTKGFHKATSSLGSAKQALDEAVEARKFHRQQWLRHLEESTALWEKQLAAYREKQAKLQEDAMEASERAETHVNEEALRKRLVTALNACVMTDNVTPIKIDSDISSEELMDGEGRAKHAKRALDDPGDALDDQSDGCSETTAADSPHDHIEDGDGSVSRPWISDFDRAHPLDFGLPPHDEQDPLVRGLHQLWAVDGVTELEEEGPVIYVQTWYLHHQDRQQCFRSRAVRLHEGLEDWVAQIQETWHDLLQPGPLNFEIVEPTPPASPSEHFSCHIILWQGSPEGRLPFLLQVRDEASSTPIVFRIALSVDEVVTGYEVCTWASFYAALFLPSVRPCQITGRQGALIVLGEPYHLVEAELVHVSFGAPHINISEADESFLVEQPYKQLRFHRHVDLRIGLEDEFPLAQLKLGTSFLSSWTQKPWHSGPTVDDSRSTTVLIARPGQTLVELYRLGRDHPHRLYVRLDQYEDMVDQMARKIHVRYADIFAVHSITPPLPGEHEGVCNFILHHVRDLEPGSTAILVLIDVEKHLNAPAFIPPRAYRKVHVLNFQVAREHLLQKIGQDVFCQRMRDVCQVFLDGVLWPVSDTRLRTLTHGNYIRVILPPPSQDYLEDCEAAVPVVQELAGVPEHERISAEDDEVTLLQLSKKSPPVQLCLDSLDLPAWQGQVLLSLAFYTDGSASDQVNVASSAVFLVVNTEHGLQFGGFRALKLDDPSFQSAPYAENAAITIALLWTLQLLDVFPQAASSCDISMNFDCLLAGRAASGEWNTNVSYSLPRLNRNLVFWIEQRHSNTLQWYHVRGHSNRPFNEAADAIAWAVLRSWFEAPSFSEVYQFITLNGTLLDDWDWVWLVIPLATTAIENDPPPLALKVVTANVLSLFGQDQRAGAFISARQEALAHLFAAEDCHIVGVQETRSKLTGYRSMPHFHALAVPANDRGVGGLQCWIRACVSLHDGRVNAQQLCDDIGPHSVEFSEHLPMATLRVLRDVHMDTRFWLPGPDAEEPVFNHILRGSRAGSPIADLVFNRLMSVLLHQLMELVNADPDIHLAASHLELPVPCLTWIDDVALPLIATSASAISPLLQRLVPKIAQLFRSFGLRLNLQPGKTEAVVQLRGTGAPEVRRQLLFEEICSLTL
eukprot:Skav223570  [mRNA]  locus=scaffold34:457927:464854:- [translate_table: standard]